MEHFEQHVIALLTDSLHRLGPMSFELTEPVIDALVANSIANLVFGEAGMWPDQDTLNSLLAYDPTLPMNHPIQADIFDTKLEDLFSFGPVLRLAWLTVAEPTLRRYAELQNCLFVPIQTSKMTALQIRGILHSVGCRLILALFARAFVRRIRSTKKDEKGERFAAHLFDILCWTILRSCERDLRLCDDLSKRFDLPHSRPSILGYKIITSQSVILHLSPYPPVSYSDIDPYLDKSISKAEGISKEWIDAFTAEVDADNVTAEAAHQAQTVKPLERIHCQWKGIRACLRGSRVYDMAKGLNDDFAWLATLE